MTYEPTKNQNETVLDWHKKEIGKYPIDCKERRHHQKRIDRLTLLTPQEVAIRLGRCPQTIKKMRLAGLLPPHSYLTPSRVAWRKCDIDLYIKCGRNLAAYNREIIKL